MKPAEWIDLIQKFPPVDFDGFGIILEGALEITLQTVLQLNADHMLIRGRTVGSTDAGRYFYIPYDRISCIVYNRNKKEEEVLGWYEGGMPPVAAASEEEPVEEEAAVEEAPAPAAPVRPAPGSRPLPVPAAARPAPAPIRPAAAPAPVRPAQPAAQQATGLQTSALANQQNNPIKTALLERLRARRQGQDAPPPEKK